MEKTNWLNQLQQQYPHITFTLGNTFRWSPSDMTVYCTTINSDQDVFSLLHETGHAISEHTTYTQDLKLLKLERQAWEVAQSTIAPMLSIKIPDDIVECALDTYRDWLHSRSTCPNCSLNGIQSDQTHYICLACDTRWRVNEARTCQLRRYVTES